MTDHLTFSWGGNTPQAAPRGAPLPTLQQLLNEGLTHHHTGRLEPARRCYEAALKLAPGQPDALNLLGVIAAQQNRRGDAIDLLTQAAASRQKDPDILNNLGRFLLEDYRFEDAREPLERAVALAPGDVNAKYNLAGVLRQLGEPDRALRLWEEVLKIEPNLRAALVGVLEVLSEQGRFDEAARRAREVAAAHPELSPAYLCLARIQKFDKDDGTLELIECRITEARSEVDEANLRYAAGKICDDLKLYDRAFVHFDLANRKAYGSWDPRTIEAERAAQQTVFTEGFFRERQGWGCDSEVPIFIVGMPRSGTSLVEQILGAHPEAFGVGEITSLERLARASTGLTAGDQPYPLNVASLSGFGAELIGRRYVSALCERAGGPAKRITDKMPHNFEQLGLIALALPKARIIHCRRNPLDTCVSCWTTAFSGAHAYNRSFEDLARYYRGYQALMAHWRRTLPIEILDVGYEELVAAPEAVARRMVEFVGLNWAPEVLGFHKHARVVRSPSLWQVRQPLYDSAVGRWRNYAAHLEQLKRALGDLA
jgi:tetratricopeptide (TPR) repeat protein